MIYNKQNNVKKGFVQSVIYNVMGEWVYVRKRSKSIFDISLCLIFAKMGIHELDDLLFININIIQHAIFFQRFMDDNISVLVTLDDLVILFFSEI